MIILGNSYTHYNSMPQNIFAALLKAAGYNATVTALTKGSQYLLYLADPDDALGKEIDAAFKQNKYDFFILQEQSTCPLLATNVFYTGVRSLNDRITANGASTILYSTWGRKTGSEILIENKWTNETMTWGLAAAYSAIGKELGADVAHAGLAFYDVFTNHPELELYNSDKTHPSKAGSYLAALTIFGQMTGVDPTTVTYHCGLSKAQSTILKEAARKAVFETSEIPAEYRTSSEGVGITFNYTVDTSQMKNLTTSPTTCLFGMEGVTGQYIRIGVIIGRHDKPDKLNTFSSREILVFGEKLA